MWRKLASFALASFGFTDYQVAHPVSERRDKRGLGGRRGSGVAGMRRLSVSVSGGRKKTKARKTADKKTVRKAAGKKGGASARRCGAKATGPGGAKKRRRKGLGTMLKEANGRAHERADRENRRLGMKAKKSMRATIAAVSGAGEIGEVAVPAASWWVGGIRLWLGAMLLPLLALTLWTFVSVFAEATLRDQFWTTAAFWYFATGVLLMAGWFWTGLLRPGFLYLYVLGHELTHIVFILLFRGRVGEWEVTTEGGYVTTDKTNIVIALAPYFVPFWTAGVLLVWALVGLFLPMPGYAEKILFWAIGMTWAFHAFWTAWMIPRDQPDLQENGTFLSLGIIGMVNTLLLAAMLCVAWDKLSFREFGETWLMHAQHWAHLLAVYSREIGGPPA